MTAITLYDKGGHQNVMLEEYGGGGMVQANHHLILHDGKGLLLDPGGHKVYSRVLGDTSARLGGGALEVIFLSHQDPDIVAAVNGWLMTTDAVAYISSLWTRFVPHFGVDALLLDRLLPIPDEGAAIRCGGQDFYAVPAHFLHSPGNFHLYDPIAKVLYTGDLGASLGQSYREVQDFDAHVGFMEGFHRRYMASSRALSAWAAMARTLDVEIIAPQHGAIFRGKELVTRFIDWCGDLACGVDLLPSPYVAKVPR